MWLKKIRLLPLLLSFLSTLTFSENYFLYKTSAGESLGDIAEKFNLEPKTISDINLEITNLKKIFNEGEELIILNRKNINQCPTGPSILTGHSPNMNTGKVWQECFSNLANLIDKEIFNETDPENFNWTKFNSSKLYHDYLLYLLRQYACTDFETECFHGRSRIKIIENKEKLINWQYKRIFKKSLSQPNSTFSWQQGYNLDFQVINWAFDFFSEIPINGCRDFFYCFYQGVDQPQAFGDFGTSQSAKSAMVKLLNLPTILRDKIIMTEMQKVYESITGNATFFLAPYFAHLQITSEQDLRYFEYSTLETIAHAMYLSLNEYEHERVIYYYNILKDIVCKDCYSYKNFISNFNHSGAYPLLLAELNYKFAETESIGFVDPALDFKKWDELYKFTFEIFDKTEDDFIKFGANDVSWATSSSIGIQYVQYERCRDAEKWYQEEYTHWRDYISDNFYENLGDDSFLSEPLDVAICFMDEFENSKDVIQTRLKYFQENFRIMENAINAGEDVVVTEETINQHRFSYSFAEAIILFINNKPKKSKKLFLQTYSQYIKINNTLISQNLINNVNANLQLIYFLEILHNTKKIDFIILDNFIKAAKFERDLHIEQLDLSLPELKNIQDEISRVTKQINNLFPLNKNPMDLTEEETSMQFYLIGKKVDLEREFLLKSKQYFGLSKIVYKNQYELIDKIKDNQKVLSYKLFSSGSFAIIYSNQGAEIINLKHGKFFYKNLNKKLRDSLDVEFDFEAAHNLYNSLFMPLEKNLNLNDSVYIFDSEDLNIPLSILTKNSPNNDNYNLNLLSAEWLIKDYSFAKLLPIFLKKNETSYEEYYLGIANSEYYKPFGLPDLSEAISEIIDLGISSNAKRVNILINKNATKEKFLSKLNTKFKRIVIAAHAVPAGWKGKVKDTSLLLGSNSNDHFLTASEIRELRIESDMVVLSSCNEDSYGFNKLYESFLIAGAESVVHSNWKLESKFSVEFTDEFFKELWFDEEIEKHEAMRNVALKFIDDYSNEKYMDPSFWGNFSIAYSTL